MEEVTTNKIDKSREIVREIQLLLYDDVTDVKNLFTKTLDLDKLLNEASIEYNKFLNKKNNK